MPDPRNIAPYGRMTRAQHFQLLNRNYSSIMNENCESVPNPFWMKPAANQWWEIGEEEYRYFLEVLPPMLFRDNAFAMCEFWSEDLTHCFMQIGDRYFAGMIQVPDSERGRANLTALRDHIKVHKDDYKTSLQPLF